MAEELKNYGKTLLAWEIREGLRHVRGAGWYIAAVAGGGALLIWAIANRNFLFAFFLIICAVVIVTAALRPARQYSFTITERGVLLGTQLYPWKGIEQFWIIYEPPEVKTLYLDFEGLRPRLPIPLENTDPNKVRTVLREFAQEDTSKTEEPLSDWFARVLKI